MIICDACARLKGHWPVIAAIGTEAPSVEASRLGHETLASQ